MNYLSTRGESPVQRFGDVLLAGVAADGGLFVPEAWPSLTGSEIAAFKDRPYTDVAYAILKSFVGDFCSGEELSDDINSAYTGFDAPEIAPLVEIGRGRYLLELFHGPTLAFKDIAMQLLARLFVRALKRRGSPATVLAATSGDTGSAAIAALGGLEGVQLFILHPHGRVTETQRRQMTCSQHANVHNLAIEGSFDDAQALVKALFADKPFAQRVKLTAVNSINFLRIAAQAVYYFTAAAKIPGAPVFVVPTGNFGDVFAGEAAMRMGLAAERLVVAANANDIIVRALNNGVYEPGPLQRTLSPSMDIQVASNFERALYEASGRDVAFIRVAMAEFRNNPRLHIPPRLLGSLQARYAAFRTDDLETLAVIRTVYRETGKIVDPHTAVALAGALKFGAPADVPVVTLATAHPAKFPDAIEAALGFRPAVPLRLKGLFEQPEKLVVVEASLPLVRAHIEARVAHHES